MMYLSEWMSTGNLVQETRISEPTWSGKNLSFGGLHYSKKEGHLYIIHWHPTPAYYWKIWKQGIIYCGVF